MSADILPYGVFRARRGLPPPLVTAGPPLPPEGKRRGDRVRVLMTGETGVVLGSRVERGHDGPVHMLAIQFRRGIVCMLEGDVIPEVKMTIRITEQRQTDFAALSTRFADLGDFLSENRDGIDAEEAEQIRLALGRGEQYAIGGGAAPLFVLSRVS